MGKSSISGMVVTRTPLRVSFAGGGTDLSEFYSRDYGAVLSTTIRQYVYVTVKRHGAGFGEPIRLNYSETEHVNRIDDVRNDIARECLRFLDVDVPIYVSTVADVPAASGLGSSSAFAVGLLNALHIWRRERVSAAQLAAEAAHVEIDVLGWPIGKQDHYAAAYGGINFYRFLQSGGVSIEAQPFDGIIVAAAAPRIPAPLADQLAPGGRLVIPVGDLASQELVILQRPARGEGEGLTQRQMGGVRFVPLISRLAFTEEL